MILVDSCRAFSRAVVAVVVLLVAAVEEASYRAQGPHDQKRAAAVVAPLVAA